MQIVRLRDDDGACCFGRISWYRPHDRTSPQEAHWEPSGATPLRGGAGLLILSTWVMLSSNRNYRMGQEASGGRL